MEVGNVPHNNLIEVRLMNCFKCEEIPMFGQLGNLNSLHLVGLGNVKSINCSFYGLEKGGTRIIFPALGTIVESMDELTEWVEVESSGVKVFPHLQHLEIEECPKLKGLPNGICTINLKELIISECPNLEDIGVQQSQGSLEQLWIINCNALQYLPFEMIGSSLDSLMLKNVSSLKNLGGIIECLPKSPHLTDLTITGVPRFMPTCLVEILPFFSCLNSLKLDVSMGGSMETIDALLQACRSSFHSLRYLTLKGIQGCWINLVESLQHFPALRNLKLETIRMEKLPQWLCRTQTESSPVDDGINFDINGYQISEYEYLFLFVFLETTFCLNIR